MKKQINQSALLEHSDTSLLFFVCHNLLGLPSVTSFQFNVSRFYFLMLDFIDCIFYQKINVCNLIKIHYRNGLDRMLIDTRTRDTLLFEG